MPRACALLLAAVLAPFSAMAAGGVTIQYKLVSLGGNNYQYIYTISNPTGSAMPVRLFDIYFPTANYQETSLQIMTPSALKAQWSELLLSSQPGGVPAAYDVLSLSGGIPAGSFVSGFTVQFHWIGPGLPGAQLFDIYDPSTFLLLQSGQTTTDPTAVPTASTWSLLLTGVGLAAASAYQATRRAHQGGPV